MAESFTAQLIRRFQIEQKKNDHSGVYMHSLKSCWRIIPTASKAAC